MKKIISYILILGLFFALKTSTALAEDISNQDNQTVEETSTQEEEKSTNEEVKNIEDIKAVELKIGDKFKINNGNKEYTVVEDNRDQIYLNSINGKDSIKLDINHFEVTTEVNGTTTSRKYVNLDELCSQTNICEFNKINVDKESYDTEISIARRYNNTIKDTIIERNENNAITGYEKIEREVYYATNHGIGTNNFESRVFVSNRQGVNPLNGTITPADGTFYNFGDNISEKFSNTGKSTLVDVESFIDSSNQVYISLRFLSEALGCRVDWLAKKIDQNTDAVLIRFYDSDSYCKKLEVTYPTPNEEGYEGKSRISSSEMYDYILKVANKGTEKSMNIDVNYNYWSDRDSKILTGKTEWSKLYLSGKAINYTENSLKAPLVEWGKNGDNLLYFSGEVNDINNPERVFALACSDNASNGEITSLENCIDLSGMIMYYGVPIPIRLLSKEADQIYNSCNIDDTTYEYIKK